MYDKSNSNSYREKLKFLRNNSQHSKYWNISYNLAIILSNFVYFRRPKKVLELGTSNGVSTLAIAENLDSNSKIITIEVDERRFNEAKGNFERFGKSKLIVQYNLELFDFLNNSNEKGFDLVFIDAAHKRYEEIVEILLSKQMIDKGSVIIADNVISHSYMKEFIEHMRNKFENTKLLEVDSGLLFVYL